MLISDSLQKWCESLANDLKDLHVPDLSVCDQLIASDFLSEDDWEVVRKTKRGKSKIKRLIKILSKRDNPKAGFVALAKCIALHHEHLSATVQTALDRFPEADINCAGYRQGVEHNEDVSAFEIQQSYPGISDDQRVPVQHDESASVDLSSGKIKGANSDPLRRTPVENEISHTLKEDNFPPTSGFGEHKEEWLCADAENCDHSNANENKYSKFMQPSIVLEHYEDHFRFVDYNCLQTDVHNKHHNNKKEINSNTDFEIIFKGHGIQCTDQDSTVTNKTYDRNLETFVTYCLANDSKVRTHSDSISTTRDNHSKDLTERSDFIGGAMGFTYTTNTPEYVHRNLADSLIDEFNKENIKLDTGSLVAFNSDTTEASHTNGPLSRLESKRIKHLIHHPLTNSKQKVEKQGKVSKPKRTSNNNYSLDTDKACSTLTDKSHPSEDSGINEVTRDLNNSQPDNRNGNCLESIDATSKYVTSAESQYFVPDRHALCINKFPGQSKLCQHEYETMNSSNCVGQTKREQPITRNQRQNVGKACFPQPHPRALSQIDCIPSFVVDNSVYRTKSWAGSSTRSHIYDGFSSNSEDYTTTDLNYSDLNEAERELCDNLEQSGSITDIVDRLIQEDYLSSDDWCAINEIKVRRNQATYVAKRISNKIHDEGLQNFSKLLKNQPGLCKWLASKFRVPVENVHLTETPLTKEYKHEQRDEVISRDEPKLSGQGVDQIDGTEKLPYCSSKERKEVLALALCGHENKSEKAVPRPENMCSPGITIDKHFQNVFDTLNTEFNKGTLPVTHLPSEPNVKCIVLYLKACDALYKTQTEDAERYIKLAEAALNDTDCPAFMKGEIFTQKTWLCLRTNRLGMMERLLEEHEQFLLAHPNVWSHKAAGWFYFDYGRFYVRMMSVTKPPRPQRQTRSPANSKTAYEVYKEKAIRCLRKSVDYFAHSDSSDGPIGMGFAISLLASVELGCVTEFDYLNRGHLVENNVSEAVKLLQTVANLYDELPDILKTSYLLSKSDLCFRRNEFGRAKELVNECAVLSDRLCLQDELKECRKRLRLLNHFV